jgi:hypothetical protein
MAALRTAGLDSGASQLRLRWIQAIYIRNWLEIETEGSLPSSQDSPTLHQQTTTTPYDFSLHIIIATANVIKTILLLVGNVFLFLLTL